MRFEQDITDLINGTDPKNLLIFAELEFPSGWVRAHTGVGDRVYNGQTYKGVGELAQIGKFKENADKGAGGLDVSLVIDDMTLFADVVQEDPTGGVARLDLVALNSERKIAGGAVLFDGHIASPHVKKGRPFSVSLRLSDWFERWSQPVQNARMTDQAQQHLHPGDKFFNQVEVLSKGVEGENAGQYVGGSGGGRFEDGRNRDTRSTK